MNKYAWLFFVLGAALSWGAYVPTIHHGQLALPPGANRALKAFLFVGVAYFLVAVLAPGVLLISRPDNAGFNRQGIGVSTIAGVLGALGALCVIFALRWGGKPIYVAPLVFAGAPIVNVIVSTIWDRTYKLPDWRFVLGILLAAIGAALVLRYKPGDTHRPTPQPRAQVVEAK
jgi:drug/metabolite transporter (DMT)-like permease